MDRLKDLWFDFESDTVNKLLITILLIALLMLINTIIRVVLHNQCKDLKKRYKWSKTTDYIMVFIGIFFIGRIWIHGFETIATFLGLLSAGIAIALKDIMLNIAGWAFIIWKKPFKAGQRIQIGENKGDVIDIRLFQFTILEICNWVNAEQSTGRMIHIPNGFVFLYPVYNYESGFSHIWNEIKFTITFESNWQKAKDLVSDILQNTAPQITNELQEQIKEASKEYFIFYSHFTPIVYTAINQSGIELQIRYLCLPRVRRKTECAIWEEILRNFAQHKDIQFAYPTTRFFTNTVEGKAEAREW